MNDNILSILLIVATTFIISALTTPFVRKLSIHIGSIAKPNHRTVHTSDMPKSGLSIFFGFLLGYMLFSRQTIIMNSVLIGSFIIILTGLFDDLKPLKPLSKLIGQVIAACVIVFYGGLIIDHIDAFGFYMNFGIFAYPITIIFIVAISNMINLIDGLDGLAAGVSSIFFLTIGIIAFLTGRMGGLDVTLAFIMLGSTLGFLLHNFYPAKIFMGDTGSLFLGFITSVIAILGFKNITLTSFVVPLLILGVPILDTAFAIIRRVLNKKPISAPDKHHMHHQLLKMNFSHRASVLIIYYINFLFSFASIVYILKDRKIGIVIYLILLVIVSWFVISTNIIFNREEAKQEKNKSK